MVKLLAPEGSPMRRYIGAALLGDVVQAVPVLLRQKVYRFRRDEIRLVIGDVALPGRNGHELAVELRDERPSLSIVLLSGCDDPGAALPTVPDTSIVMLQKPPAFDELLGVVRAELDAG